MRFVKLSFVIALVVAISFLETSNAQAQVQFTDGYYEIRAQHSGLTLDVFDAGGEYAVVQTAGQGGQPNRQWRFVPVGDGYYNIIARHSQLSLDVRDAGGEFAVVQTAGMGGQRNREWKIVSVPGGSYKISARHSGKSLDVRGAGGERALLQTCGDGGQRNREFSITPVAPKGQNFYVNLNNFVIVRTRARGNDTVHVSFSLKVGGKKYDTLFKHMGNRNDGVHTVGLSFGPIDFPPANTPVVLNYVLANVGHKDNNNAEFEKAAKAGSDQLINQMINRDIGEDWKIKVLREVVRFGLSLLFADCDGVVAADQIILNSDTLKEWGYRHSETREYPGTDSAPGCGANSIYRVTWSIRD